MTTLAPNTRPQPDHVLVDMAHYVADYEVTSTESCRLACYCLMDALGCAVAAFEHADCRRLIGPPVPGLTCPNAARVPATTLEMDPVNAAFSTGAMIRWLDFNDSFTAADGSHPSDALGGILSAADYASRTRVAEGRRPLLMRDVLTATIKAYEIIGAFVLENSFTAIGCDHAVMTRVATAAVVTRLLGGGVPEITNAVSNAWADGLTLKVYRQSPNTGTRKNWAAGDETARGVRLALMAMCGEMGYPSVLTARRFGFYEALFRGRAFEFQRPYGNYVIEHVLFKFAAAGMHAQTAIECALKLHPLVKDRLEDIETITLSTQKALIGIMHKEGPLHNAADRDHCAQYVIAVALIYGRLTASDFEDERAADPRIDRLRAKIKVVENLRYTQEFQDPHKRTSANALRITFTTSAESLESESEYPLGHSRRRAEALPLLKAKFKSNIAHAYTAAQQEMIVQAFDDPTRLETMAVNDFVALFVP